MSKRPVATVTHLGLFDLQLCVPEDWDDKRIKNFADQATLCGTKKGWRVRQKNPNGDPKRVPCADFPGFVHVMLDA